MSRPRATGSLAYTPLPGVSGSAVITVVVTDGGLDNDLGTSGDNGTVTRTFTVVVNPVEDPPTLDAIADPAAINEDAGLQTVNLTGISAGAGESQALTVTATQQHHGPDPESDGDLHVARCDRLADLHAGRECVAARR